MSICVRTCVRAGYQGSTVQDHHARHGQGNPGCWFSLRYANKLVYSQKAIAGQMVMTPSNANLKAMFPFLMATPSHKQSVLVSLSSVTPPPVVSNYRQMNAIANPIVNEAPSIMFVHVNDPQE